MASVVNIVYLVCCGIDVHKNLLVACIATTDSRGYTTIGIDLRCSLLDNNEYNAKKSLSRSNMNNAEKLLYYLPKEYETTAKMCGIMKRVQ